MTGAEVLRRRTEIIARIDSSRRLFEWDEREGLRQIRDLQKICAHLRQDLSTSQLGVERICLDCGADVNS